MNAQLQRIRLAVTGKQSVTAVLAGIAAVAGSFAAAGLTEAFAFTPVSSFVVHNTPAVIINTTLDVFGAYGQLINMSFTLFVTVALFTVATGIALELGRHSVGRAPSTAVFVWLFAFTLTGAPLLSLGSAVPAALVVVLAYRPWKDELSLHEDRRWPDRDRRQVLETSFGVVGFAGAAYIAGSYRSPAEDLPGLDEFADEDVSGAEELLGEAEMKSFDLPGSPDLVSEIGNFYTIDIASVPPTIDADDWTLEVSGEVDSPETFSYDELRGMNSEHRFSTLRCVGEGLNDREMDNGVWTGVQASEISERTGATGDYVAMHADDGFWNVITREAFEQSFVVYGMNGNVLPREHGHPVRVIVPGHWGEVNVKWLTEIEFLDENIDGYWEERGWDGTGEVSAVAKLWTVEETAEGVLLGGQAYDGHDGVDRVEISTDGGETWEETAITEPLSIGDGWRQWRYELTEPGEYEVVVRMIDRDGNVQDSERTSSRPDGARGWVTDTINVE